MRRSGDAHHHRRRGINLQRRGLLHYRQPFLGLQKSRKLRQFLFKHAVALDIAVIALIDITIAFVKR